MGESGVITGGLRSKGGRETEGEGERPGRLCRQRARSQGGGRLPQVTATPADNLELISANNWREPEADPSQSHSEECGVAHILDFGLVRPTTLPR